MLAVTLRQTPARAQFSRQEYGDESDKHDQRWPHGDRR
jgi:hypothetical protein